MSKDIDKLGIFDRIKVFFATLACLAAGGFMVWGPVEEIDPKFEYFAEIGFGFLAFGTMFGLILLTEGSAGGAGREFNFRIKSLMAMIATGALAVGLFWGFVPEVVDCWKLSNGGTATTGRIVDRRQKLGYKNSRIKQVRVAYDSRKKWVDGWGSVGADYPVVYMADDPDRMHMGVQDDGFLGMLDRGTGRWKSFGFLALGLLMALWSLTKAKHFFFGRSDAPEPA